MPLHPEDAPITVVAKSMSLFHQHEAEELLRSASLGDSSRANLVAKAQVHATLALVEVLREQGHV